MAVQDDYKVYLEQSVRDIAAAIRTKNKSEQKYKIGDMAKAIEDIEIPEPVEYEDCNTKKY